MKQSVSEMEFISKACKRAALKWKAGESLRRKLVQEGADLGSPAAQKAINDLALALSVK